MSPRKKSVVVAGEFCLVKMVAILHTEKVELHLLPESAAHDVLADMRFHKDNPLPCICIVAKETTANLQLQETYLMQLEKKPKP
jgi:hypothetical protein